MDIVGLEQRRVAYSRFADLCGILNDFSYHNDSKITEELKAMVQLNSQIGMPLPSGRWGNCVALEM